MLTEAFAGEDGRVAALQCARSELVDGPDGRKAIQVVPGSRFEIKADLVLLAMGFTGPRRASAVESSGVELTSLGNVKAGVQDYRTSRDRVFACGDMRRGQSLVVWAIREGRECADAVHAWLEAEQGAQAARAA